MFYLYQLIVYKNVMLAMILKHDIQELVLEP